MDDVLPIPVTPQIEKVLRICKQKKWYMYNCVN